MDVKAAPTGETVDLRTLDDKALLDAVLRRDGKAWRELVRRHEPVVRHQVGRVLARHREVLPSDAVDDIVGDFYVGLMGGEMRKLRGYARSSRTAKLASWLGLLATQAAFRYLRRMYRNLAVPRVEDRDLDPNRGGEWLGREREE